MVCFLVDQLGLLGGLAEYAFFEELELERDDLFEDRVVDCLVEFLLEAEVVEMVVNLGLDDCCEFREIEVWDVYELLLELYCFVLLFNIDLFVVLLDFVVTQVSCNEILELSLFEYLLFVRWIFCELSQELDLGSELVPSL